MSEEITHLLGQGLITQSTSPWAAPIAVARKTNGQIQLAIDYRALNAQTFDQHHPIRRIDDLIDRLGEAKYFSSLDLKSGYYQMPLYVKKILTLQDLSPRMAISSGHVKVPRLVYLEHQPPSTV